MLYSFEIPTRYLETFYKDQDYLFCIASQARDSTTYLEFYKDKAKEKYVILDSYSADKEESVSFKDLLSLAKEIGVKEIIPSMRLHDYPGTVKRIKDMFTYLEAKELLNEYAIQLVPQGKTLEEVLNCFSKLDRLPASIPKTFGMPASILKATTPYRAEQFRFTILQRLAQKGLLKNKHIHLLGLNAVQFMKAYKKGQRFFRIRSINTAFPVALGIAGQTFEQTKKKPAEKINHDMPLIKSTLQNIHKNIKWLKEYK